MDPKKSDGIGQNNIYVLHRMQQNFRLCRSQLTVEHIKKHGSAGTPYSPHKGPVHVTRIRSTNEIW